ncbi:MAG: aminoglycoside phosphotransferase family protein [Alphaproteobacteria bacterium]|nr:aminoglycoside phosphotransferase family protein [Alphaproteobacteria bacterium]
MTTIAERLPALHRALKDHPGFDGLSLEDLAPFPTTGLAHDHVAIEGRNLLLRVPRQSQMRLDAARNLTYQAACFERMSRGGHAPACHGILMPSVELPMGALIVDRIRGRVLSAPEELPLAAEALASIHALPVPAQVDRAPLIDQPNPMAATLAEVQGQAIFLDHADLHPDSADMIAEELTAAARDAADLPPAPARLISFDAHPGNFMVDGKGRAFLVDLEKGRYGGAGFDLAHATLYTSTTWDVATYSEPSRTQVDEFYDAWRGAMPGDLAASLEPYLMPMRRLMWLWSVTWCAKWRVESRKTLRADKQDAKDTEDWSAENTDTALIDHVRGRVDCYLSPDIVARVRSDWA